MRVVPRVVADEKNQFEVAHAREDGAVHIARWHRPEASSCLSAHGRPAHEAFRGRSSTSSVRGGDALPTMAVHWSTPSTPGRARREEQIGKVVVASAPPCMSCLAPRLGCENSCSYSQAEATRRRQLWTPPSK